MLYVPRTKNERTNFSKLTYSSEKPHLHIAAGLHDLSNPEITWHYYSVIIGQLVNGKKKIVGGK